HNAFRAPGAPSLEELRRPLPKVDYFAGIYGRMHRGIRTHPEFLASTNLDLLGSVRFAFLCFDDAPAKIALIQYLEANGVSFVDVGIQVLKKSRGLTGSLRVTTSTPEKRDHFRRQVPLDGNHEPDEYNENIQIAEINALNAALAVVRWKRLMGYYVDQQ